MNKKIFILSIAAGLLWANGAFASDPRSEKDQKVLNSITYIGEDADFELGFDTFDYLPEGFDPFKIYVDLNAIVFLEDEKFDDFASKKHLPDNFDAYVFPTDVESINYIDEADAIELDFDTQEHLPEGFDPYMRNGK
jgi:hypothetical protein